MEVKLRFPIESAESNKNIYSEQRHWAGEVHLATLELPDPAPCTVKPYVTFFHPHWKT